MSSRPLAGVRMRQMKLSRVCTLISIRRLSTNKSNDQYCVDLVKRQDHDNYLAGLLIPREFRNLFYAVRAFNAETSTIKDQVHGNSMTGRIRYQWWRDALEKSEASAPCDNGHPVIGAITQNFKQHNISYHLLHRALDARQKELAMGNLSSISELEDYAEQCHSSLMYCMLNATGINNEKAEIYTSHLGVCAGIAILIRGIPYHRQGECYIPQQLLATHNVTERVLSAAQAGKCSAHELANIKECVYHMACQAFGHLDRARETVKNQQEVQSFSKGLVRCGLPAVRARLFLDDLRAVDFDPFSPTLLNTPMNTVKYQLALLKAVATSQI